MTTSRPTVEADIARRATRLLQPIACCVRLPTVDVVDRQIDRRGVDRSYGGNAYERRNALASYTELCWGPGMTDTRT